MARCSGYAASASSQPSALSLGCYLHRLPSPSTVWRIHWRAKGSASLISRGRGPRDVQLCSVLSLVSAAGCLQPAQMHSLPLLLCDSASSGLPVGVLLGPNLPLLFFSPCQLCARENPTLLPLCTVTALTLRAAGVLSLSDRLLSDNRAAGAPWHALVCSDGALLLGLVTSGYQKFLHISYGNACFPHQKSRGRELCMPSSKDLLHCLPGNPLGNLSQGRLSDLDSVYGNTCRRQKACMMPAEGAPGCKSLPVPCYCLLRWKACCLPLLISACAPRV